MNKEELTEFVKRLDKIHTELALCDMLDDEYDSISLKLIKAKSEIYKYI